MTWLYYIIIFLPITILAIGGSMCLFKTGTKEEICSYGYTEGGKDELSENNQ